MTSVTGNPIRPIYIAPGGSDPLAESIRRIGFASRSDLPPDQVLIVDSILCRENDPSLMQVFRQEKPPAVRMVYDFSMLLEHLTLF